MGVDGTKLSNETPVPRKRQKCESVPVCRLCDHDSVKSYTDPNLSPSFLRVKKMKAKRNLASLPQRTLRGQSRKLWLCLGCLEWQVAC